MTWQDWSWLGSIPDGVRWIAGAVVTLCIIALIVYWCLFPYNVDKRLREQHATLKSIEDTLGKLLDLELVKQNGGPRPRAAQRSDEHGNG